MGKDENLIGNSRYMIDFLGNEYYYECAGCDISNKIITPPGGIIYEDDSFIVGSDPDIPLEGFLVVTAKRHINSITDLKKEEQYKLMDIVNKSISVLKKLNVTKKVIVLQEERSKHFHMWIFPNNDWMVKKFGQGASYIRDICDYMKENASDEYIEQVLETIKKIKENYHKI